eukprot:CAMPEP_0178652872 /NCGR_PEP_ID=MMETSP0698-20121128/22872_1 /TAXON_ID=265572 /ORGANISM="Extubocellulus spinifer, Strain CCMP396" /LENGTH=76 /DNA_ID=CAMNT_0020294589 /DNA_START=88 /DNA_END=321 /DNA_ORIENTATION=+
MADGGHRWTTCSLTTTEVAVQARVRSSSRGGPVRQQSDISPTSVRQQSDKRGGAAMALLQTTRLDSTRLDDSAQLQ